MNMRKHTPFIARTIIELIVMLALVGLLSGCSTKKVVQKERSDEKVRIEYREIWHTDTVTVPLPGERIEVIRTDSSHLETALSVSKASIRPDGTLYHTLENKPFSPRIEVKWKDRIILRDSIVYRDKEIPYPVEKELNRWQKFRMNIGGYALLALAGIGVYYAVKLLNRIKK